MILTSCLLWAIKRKKESVAESYRRVTAAFADSAIALALSVELAAAIMLIRKYYGLGANDFGDVTVQLVWIVATLVMLPIVTFCWLDFKDDRGELRLCMLSFGLILFLINFCCRMYSTYSSGQVGNLNDTDKVITPEELGQIQYLCYEGHKALSPGGSVVVEVFSIGGSLWIFCNILSALMDQSMSITSSSKAGHMWQNIIQSLRKEQTCLMISVPAVVGWSVPLFWAMMQLRTWQKQFAASLNETSGSDVWTFGQIIAVVVFLPVLNEILFQYLNKPRIPAASSSPPATQVQPVVQLGKASTV